LIWASILAGFSAMKTLRGHFQRSAAELPAGVPPIQTTGTALRFGQLGPILIPLLFMAVWLVLLLHY
jgi:hypothetical protein